MCGAYAHKVGPANVDTSHLSAGCTPLNTRWILYFCYGLAWLGFLLVQCGILLFGELAFHSLTLPFWLRMRVYMGALAHAHYSFAVFVSFIVVFWKKLCIRPLKTAHELTTVAIWKTIFVRQLTIFMADSLFFSLSRLSLDSFARYTHTLAFVG